MKSRHSLTGLALLIVISGCTYSSNPPQSPIPPPAASQPNNNFDLIPGSGGTRATGTGGSGIRSGSGGASAGTGGNTGIGSGGTGLTGTGGSGIRSGSGGASAGTGENTGIGSGGTGLIGTGGSGIRSGSGGETSAGTGGNIGGGGSGGASPTESTISTTGSGGNTSDCTSTDKAYHLTVNTTAQTINIHVEGLPNDLFGAPRSGIIRILNNGDTDIVSPLTITNATSTTLTILPHDTEHTIQAEDVNTFIDGIFQATVSSSDGNTINVSYSLITPPRITISDFSSPCTTINTLSPSNTGSGGFMAPTIERFTDPSILTNPPIPKPFPDPAPTK